MVRHLIWLGVICLSISACSLPRVHKITVQQGNVITQDMVNRLRPGMTRSQVAFIMGEPVLRHTFEADRWDYIYSVEIPGRFKQDWQISLFFENDVLAYFTGDFAPSDTLEEATAERSDADSDDADEPPLIGNEQASLSN